MLPLAMNELIQKNLKDVGLDMEVQPVEWNTLLTRWRAGFHTPENEGLNGWNISLAFPDPSSAFQRFFHSRSVIPTSLNTMPYLKPGGGRDPRRRREDVRREGAGSPARQAARGARRRRAVDLHRTRPEPRAMSAKVKGFVSATTAGAAWRCDASQVGSLQAPLEPTHARGRTGPVKPRGALA